MVRAGAEAIGHEFFEFGPEGDVHADTPFGYSSDTTITYFVITGQARPFPVSPDGSPRQSYFGGRYERPEKKRCPCTNISRTAGFL